MNLVEYITTFIEFYVITMSNSESSTLNDDIKNTTNQNDSPGSGEMDTSLEKAIELYKKIYEKEDMSEKERKEMEHICELIKNRQIIT